MQESILTPIIDINNKEMSSELMNINKKEAISNQKDKKVILSQIYSKYYDRLYKFFIYRTNNQHVSEELTSIVFEKIVVNIESFDSNKSPLSAWIFTIARNSMYDYFRTDKSKDKSPIEDYENQLLSDINTEAYIEKTEKNKELMEYVKRLTERERSIIAYKFGAELSNIEIAKVMDLSATNVGSILHRSMKKLKNMMEE